MKTKLFTIALAALTVWLLASFKKDNGPETPKLPEGALSGEFSVSATKTVHFSRGNLYYDGSAFKFETNQYEFPSTWNASHVGHFYWSKDASVAYVVEYEDDSASEDDVFFTNATAETAKADFTVNGVTGQYRTLSENEWNYLFKSRSNASTLYKYGVTVIGKANCVVIAPDNWDTSANPLQASYDADAWATAESAGLVCLPAAGARDGSDVRIVGDVGFYWSSSADDSGHAYLVIFYSNNVSPDADDARFEGCSVRLITESK